MPDARRARVSPAEWRAVLLAAALVTLVTTLPYLVAAAAAGADWHFGGFLFGVEDGNSYLGKMRLGARGEWAFSLFYTPEAHDPVPLVNLPYIVPGQMVGALLGADHPALTPALIVTFHALRVLCAAVYLVVLYRFIAHFTCLRSVRMTALWLAALGGGLGWLLSLTGASAQLGGIPPEFYIPEGFSFLILFGLPHLALARAALLGGLLFLLVALERKTDWLAWSGAAGAAWLVVGLSVPFYFAVIYAVTAAWGVVLWIQRRRFPFGFGVRAGLAVALTLPLFGYFALVFTQNSAFAQWSAQNQLASPAPLWYVLAYGLIAVPALVGARWAWRRSRRQTGAALLLGWVLVVPLLVYLPFINVQRRLSEAVIVPLAILAAVGLRLWLRRRVRWQQARHVYAVVASLSSVFLLVGAGFAALAPRAPLFRPAAEVALFDWLNMHSRADQVALSTVDVGNALPAWTHLRTFMGHGPETLYWWDKTEAIRRLFADEMTASERAALFARYRVAYVIAPPDVAPAPSGWHDALRMVYARDGYRVYAVGG